MTLTFVADPLRESILDYCGYNMGQIPILYEWITRILSAVFASSCVTVQGFKGSGVQRFRVKRFRGLGFTENLNHSFVNSALHVEGMRIERGEHMSYPPKFEDIEAWQLARGE
mgnify:CR=1 FL=1